MAGAGFKTFASGEVLTAANVNTYLMQQTVMVFADSSARSTALGANVSEGMLSYLKDTNQVEVYNGSAWVASDDPNAIQNTIVDAKGDLISATAADTPARLASSGVNGEVLTIDTSTATGLKWAAQGGLGWSQLATGSVTGASISITGLSSKEYLVYLAGWSHDDVSNQGLKLQFNSDTGTNYGASNTGSTATSIILTGATNAAQSIYSIAYVLAAGDTEEVKVVLCPGSTSAIGGNYLSTSAITSIQLFPSGGNFDAGTYYVYGRG